MRWLLRIVSVGFATLILIALYILLIPRNYNVPEWIEREGTEIWDLKTGSSIGVYSVISESIIKKKPILYLHGGPGGFIKDPVIRVLSPLASIGHDIYFYDQVGSGHSERLSDIMEYSINRHRDDLHEIIDRITDDQVILIGHSWGSLLAVEYLKQNPDRVQSIILESPGPLLPFRSDLSKTKAPDSLELRAPSFTNQQGNQEARNLRSILVQKYAYLRGKKLASDQEMDAFFTYLNQFLSRSTVCNQMNLKPFPGGGGYYAHIMTYRSLSDVPDSKENLRSIETPLLLMKGQCDNQYWGFNQEYLDIFPNTRIEIISDAGHDIISENEVAYFQTVRDFLNVLD